MQRIDQKRLLIIVISGLAFSLLYNWESRSNPFYLAPIVDAQTFLEQALSLATTGSFPDTEEPFWQPPGYPFFLSILCRIFPTDYFIALRVLQSFLGAASVLLLHFLGRRAGSLVTAHTAALLTAGNGALLYFSGELLGVTLEIFVNTLLLYSIVEACRSKASRHWVYVGCLAGIASLTRPNILLFIGILIPWVSWRQSSACHWKSMGRRTLLIGLPLVMVVLPVTLRNYLKSGELIFISSNAGINFYIGNNATYDSTVAIHPGVHWENLTMEPVRAGYTSAAARSRFFLAKSAHYIVTNPLDYSILLLKKLWIFWSGPEWKRNQDIYYARIHSRLLSLLLWDKWGISFPFGLIGPLSVLGLWITRHSKNLSLRILRLYTLSYVASVVLFFVSARYRAPVLPLIIFFAAVALEKSYRLLRKKSWPPLLLGCGSFLVLLVILNWKAPPNLREDAQLYHDLGEASLRQGVYEAAIGHLRKSIALNPNYPSAHLNIAVAYLTLKLHDNAIISARQALEQNPREFRSRIVLGQAYMGKHRWQAAVESLSLVVKDHPKIGEAQYYLGRALAKQGLTDRAIPHFVAAIEEGHDDYWTLYELGGAYQESSRLEDASRAFRRAHNSAPKKPEALNALGAVCILQQDLPAARNFLQQALALDPNNSQALMNLGFLSLRQQRPQEAVQLLEHAVELNPASPKAVYVELLKAYRLAEEKEKAQDLNHRIQRLRSAPQ